MQTELVAGHVLFFVGTLVVGWKLWSLEGPRALLSVKKPLLWGVLSLLVGLHLAHEIVAEQARSPSAPAVVSSAGR